MPIKYSSLVIFVNGHCIEIAFAFESGGQHPYDFERAFFGDFDFRLTHFVKNLCEPIIRKVILERRIKSKAKRLSNSRLKARKGIFPLKAQALIETKTRDRHSRTSALVDGFQLLFEPLSRACVHDAIFRGCSSYASRLDTDQPDEIVSPEIVLPEMFIVAVVFEAESAALRRESR